MQSSDVPASIQPGSIPIDALPGPACVLDAADGSALWHNAAFAAWIGQDAIDGLPLDRLFPGDPAPARLFAEALALDATVEHHTARSDASGARSLYCLRARRIEPGVLLWATEVTALAQAWRAIHDCQRDYVAMTAHELRGPLTSIKAWACAADQKRPGDARRGAPDRSPLVSDALQAIVRQVDRMSELLTDLLDVARDGAGALRAARTVVDVEDLVTRACAASPFGLDVTVRRPLPGAVFCDVLHLEVVLGKLIAHAARRRREAPVEVSAEASDGEVRVSVIDRGPPLGAEAEGDLFGRFSRSGRRQGGGLGLYLCQQLVAHEGGRIWIEHEGSASRLVVALPDAGRADLDAEEPDGRRSAIPRAALRPLRILVADRDAALVGRAVSVLRLGGHDPAGVASGERFWQLLEHDGAIDAVLVDLQMPDVAGLVAIERIRAAASPPAIVVLSPSVERPAALAGVERAGALAVIPKPVDWPHLVALINAVASARATAKGSG